jgi:uncharacterized membrane protein YGL010W
MKLIPAWIESRLDDQKRNTLALLGGMGALMAGRKRAGLTMFARGAWGLEKGWRQKHPEFDGSFKQRWALSVAFYEQTHQNDKNRWLHMVGIPMIVGGAAGLLAATPKRPLWRASAWLFGVGWTLNFIGHGVFEKNAPAFADDPLSFIAGPAWDLIQWRRKLQGGAAANASTDAAANADAADPATVGA